MQRQVPLVLLCSKLCWRRTSEAFGPRTARARASSRRSPFFLWGCALSFSVLMLCAIGSWTVETGGGVARGVVQRARLCAFKRLVPAPMIPGFVLGPQMEDNVRRVMHIASGEPMLLSNRRSAAPWWSRRLCYSHWWCCRRSVPGAPRCIRRLA